MILINLIYLISNFSFSPTAYGANSMAFEQKSNEISKKLKIISPSTWEKMIQDKANESYVVQKGDTLSGISLKLFGDASYWPKIWEVNNQKLWNPHALIPGSLIKFFPGTTNSPPSIALENTLLPAPAGGVEFYTGQPKMVHPTASNPAETLVLRVGLPDQRYTSQSINNEQPGPTTDDRTPPQSKEWLKINSAPWDYKPKKLGTAVDQDGFDERNFQRPIIRSRSEHPAFLTDSKVVPLAVIKGSRREDIHLSDRSLVTLEADASENMKPGETYTVVGDPIRVRGKNGKSYLYPIGGSIQLDQKQGDTWLAKTFNIQSDIGRGALVISFPRFFTRTAPKPAKQSVFTSVHLYSPTSTFVTSQFRWIAFGSGHEEGVEPGMIFRIFQRRDPKTGKNLLPEPKIVMADAQVYQVSENMSLGYVIRSKREIEAESEALLLTDVSDVLPTIKQLPPPILTRKPEKPPIPLPVALKKPAQTTSKKSTLVLTPPENSNLAAGPENLPAIPPPMLPKQIQAKKTPVPSAKNPDLKAKEKAAQTNESLRENKDWLEELDQDDALSSTEQMELDQLEKLDRLPDEKPELKAESQTPEPDLEEPANVQPLTQESPAPEPNLNELPKPTETQKVETSPAPNTADELTEDSDVM